MLTPGSVLQLSYVLLWIKPRLTLCKESKITQILSLWPHSSFSEGVWNYIQWCLGPTFDSVLGRYSSKCSGTMWN